MRTPAIQLLYKCCESLHKLAEKFYFIAVFARTAMKQKQRFHSLFQLVLLYFILSLMCKCLNYARLDVSERPRSAKEAKRKPSTMLSAVDPSSHVMCRKQVAWHCWEANGMEHGLNGDGDAQMTNGRLSCSENTASPSEHTFAFRVTILSHSCVYNQLRRFKQISGE